MIRNLISKIFVILGCISIAVAAFLFCYDRNDESTAKMDSAHAVDIIREEVEENVTVDVESVVIEEEITVDHNSYMGILEIPALGLELPVQDSWSYPKLKSSPCLYTENPMSIAAHNYQAHFGRLKSLVEGDIAVFTFISGEIKTYEVTEVTLIYETDIEAFEEGNSDLTLFTCNYSNNTERVVVKLQETVE